MAYDNKYGEIEVPGVPDNEPIFILRAQDILAIHMLQVYKGLRESTGDLNAVRALEGTIEGFKNWKFKKIPD